MFDPKASLIKRAPEARHVPGRENAWRRRTAVFIGHDALLDVQPGCLGKLGPGLRADADNDWR
jgi:hypothetical protein